MGASQIGDEVLRDRGIDAAPSRDDDEIGASESASARRWSEDEATRSAQTA
jgi:hypothetical protein